VTMEECRVGEGFDRFDTNANSTMSYVTDDMAVR